MKYFSWLIIYRPSFSLINVLISSSECRSILYHLLMQRSFLKNSPRPVICRITSAESIYGMFFAWTISFKQGYPSESEFKREIGIIKWHFSSHDIDQQKSSVRSARILSSLLMNHLIEMSAWILPDGHVDQYNSETHLPRQSFLNGYPTNHTMKMPRWYGTK